MKEYKIGIISDIHGNDLALKLALNDLIDCNKIISLGDLIGIGPNSNEVLNIVRNISNFSTVLGNHEKYYLYGFNNPTSCMNASAVEWVKNSISKENDLYLKQIPMEIVITHKSKKILFTHYARYDRDSLSDMHFKSIIHDPSYNDLCELFRKYNEDIIIFGHEHKLLDIKENKWFINPGSTGCPSPKKDTYRYGVLNLSDEITYTEYEKEYNPEQIISDMNRKNMPDKEFIQKAFYLIRE